MKKHLKNGFTVVELLVVVVIISTLAILLFASLAQARTKTHTAVAQSELRSMANAFLLYQLDNDAYPNDTNSNVLPAGMESYVPGAGWPEGPYQNSEYEWDYWNPGTIHEAAQVSVRFCADGSCEFPDEPWASSFTNGQNAAYWCISGQCRPWETDVTSTVPGHCFNC